MSTNVSDLVKDEENKDEFDSEASLREVYLFNLYSQGNIYTLSTMLLNQSQKLLVGTLNRKVYCLEFDRHHLEAESGSQPAVKDLQFTYIPSGAEIISLDAFNRTSHNNDLVIGITIIKLPTSDTSGDSDSNSTSSGGQYLNIYSDWDQPQGSAAFSTGYFLENLSQGCFSLELDFIPYQLTHCSVATPRSASEVVWILLGSDNRAHIFVEDPNCHSYIDGTESFLRFFPELDREFLSVPLWIEFYHTEDGKHRMTAVGCEDGELALFVVEIETLSPKIVNSYEVEFEGAISQVKFFKPFDDQLRPPEGFDLAEGASLVEDPAPVHLLVVSAVSQSAVFENVLFKGLSFGRMLVRSDEFDVTTCGTIADVDFDGKKEVVLGTFGQEILVYKLLEKVGHDGKNALMWDLIWTRPLSSPIMGIVSLDLTGEGVEEIAVATTTGLQILQHDMAKVQTMLRERYDRYLTQLD